MVERCFSFLWMTALGCVLGWVAIVKNASELEISGHSRPSIHEVLRQRFALSL